MNKMYKLFVDTINKAVMSADLVGDSYQKSMAYASTAQALATYLSGVNTSNMDNVTVEEDAKIDSNTQNTDKVEEPITDEDAIKISETNKKVLEAMDKAIKDVENKQQEEINQSSKDNEIKSTKDEWTLKFDEEGVPLLEGEDFSIPERVLAYEIAYNTPEVEAIVRRREIEAGEKLIAEMNAQAGQPQQPEAPTEIENKTVEYSQDEVNKLEEYKLVFGYEADPSILDNMFFNFTDGVKRTLSDLTPELLSAFLLFIKEETTKAYEEVEMWKESWIGKEGLDVLISQAYGVESGTLEEYLNDGNVQWFVSYIRLYNANAYYQGWYEGQIDRDSLNAYIRECFEDQDMNADSINDDNVIVIYSYINAMMQQTA